MRSTGTRGRIFGRDSRNTQDIDDSDVAVLYRRLWVFSVNDSSTTDDKTTHSTSDPDASVSLVFYGSRVQVVGDIPAGKDKLTSDYIIDDDPPVSGEVPILAQNFSLHHRVLFSSEILSEGQHRIIINAINSTGDRNFTITKFLITTIKNPVNDRNVGAIVGGIVSALIVLSLLLLGAFYFRRRRILLRSTLPKSQPPDGRYNIPTGPELPISEPSPFVIELGTSRHGPEPRELDHYPMVIQDPLVLTARLSSRYSSMGAHYGSPLDLASSVSQTFVARSSPTDQAPRQGVDGQVVLRKYHEITSLFRAARVQN
ncbi:hypothetical protein M0805_001491 [Coniferiporia weirii]|nr:hypothetical protein M0805_001491 [Coniferiporia weirii]